jgi:hypothetical protein
MKVWRHIRSGKIPTCSPLAFDSGLKRLYVSAESGNVTIFREQRKRLVSEGGLFTAHAHTVCVDPDTHLVYFPLQDIDGHPSFGSWNPPPLISLIERRHSASLQFQMG